MNASTPSGAAARMRSLDAVPVDDRLHAVLAQPRVVGLARQPDHRAPRSTPNCTTSDRRRPRRPRRRAPRRGWGSTARTAAQAVAPATCSAPACSHADARRLAQQLRGRHDDELGLARAGLDEADHLVADRPAGHAVADLLDHAGEVAALARRERRRVQLGHQAPADRGLARVDPRRAHGDEHLARAGHAAARPPRRAGRRCHRIRHISHARVMKTALKRAQRDVPCLKARDAYAIVPHQWTFSQISSNAAAPAAPRSPNRRSTASGACASPAPPRSPSTRSSTARCTAGSTSRRARKGSSAAT